MRYRLFGCLVAYWSWSGRSARGTHNIRFEHRPIIVEWHIIRRLSKIDFSYIDFNHYFIFPPAAPVWKVEVISTTSPRATTQSSVGKYNILVHIDWRINRYMFQTYLNLFYLLYPPDFISIATTRVHIENTCRMGLRERAYVAKITCRLKKAWSPMQ